MADIFPSVGHLAATGYPPGIVQEPASSAAQSFFIETGTVGTSHVVTSRRFRGFTPGQPFFLSFLYKADRTTGVGLLALKARINWYGAAGLLTPTDHDISIDADVATSFVEKRHTAPAGAIEGEVVFTATPAASPMQHNLWVAGIRLGRTEAGAELTAVVEGPPTASFAHSSTGTAEAGQFPRTLVYKLLVGGAEVTSGVTWTYLVRSGTVNGFALADGAQSMASGGLTVSSLSTNNAVVEVYATYNGVARFTSLTLTKTFAAPESSSGGGSTEAQTSGFTTVTTTGFTVISNVLDTTLPAGKTQINVSVSLGIVPNVASPAGLNNLEFKVQRNIASVWTDIGSVQNSSPDPAVTEDGVDFVGSDGTASFTINDTGLAASSSYQHRVVARYSSGSSTHQPFYFYGTIQTIIP